MKICLFYIFIWVGEQEINLPKQRKVDFYANFPTEYLRYIYFVVKLLHNEVHCSVKFTTCHFSSIHNLTAGASPIKLKLCLKQGSHEFRILLNYAGHWSFICKRCWSWLLVNYRFPTLPDLCPSSPSQGPTARSFPLPTCFTTALLVKAVVSPYPPSEQSEHAENSCCVCVACASWVKKNCLFSKNFFLKMPIHKKNGNMCYVLRISVRAVKE